MNSKTKNSRGPVVALGVFLAVCLLLILTIVVLRDGGATRSRPTAATLPGQLYYDEDFAVRLWMPTPAENLELLAGAEVRSALPGGLSFGPFVLPPAREATVALDADGGVAAFRFAPWQATLARWAGRLAGNAVLAGGRVEEGARNVSTLWRGATWVVTVDSSWPAESPEAAPQRSELPDALGWVALGAAARGELSQLLRAEIAPAPFEIVDLEDGWGLSQEGATWAPPFEPPEDAGLAAVRYESRADDWALTLLEAPQGEARRGELRLPSSGARFGGAFSPQQLPAGRWLEDLALNPLYDECGSATCVAWDQRGLRLAQAVQRPAIEGDGTSVWLWNEALAEFLDRFADGLDGLLLVPSQEVEAARSAAEWARPLRQWQRATLHAESGALAVRLVDADLD